MLRAQPARLLAAEKSMPEPRLILLRKHDAAIGRAAGSSLTLESPDIADRHAMILYRRGRYYLIDLKAGGATRVNGRPLRRGYRLKHGDRLSFSNASHYRFLDPDAGKRRRNRRLCQAATLVVIVTAGLIAHAAGFDRGALSPTNLIALLRIDEPRPAAARPSVALSAPIPSPSAAPAPSPPSVISAASSAEVAPRSAVTARHHETAVRLANAAHTPKPVPAASASPYSAPSPAILTATRTDALWLPLLNHYRAIASLPPLKEDPQLTAAVTAHAHYLMANYPRKIRAGDPLGDADHDEDPARPGYSASGKSIAVNSQIAWGCGQRDIDAQLEQWIAGPFDRFEILNPAVRQAGFGEARMNGCWVAALRLPPGPEEVKPYAHAVEFPPDGSSISIRWNGIEWPDPLTGCPGYSAPAGFPITLQLGRLVNADLSAHSLTHDGDTIESCAFDAHSYRNPSADGQEYGRWALRSSGAAVVIPRAPLDPGEYAVSITAHGVVYAWSFRISN